MLAWFYHLANKYLNVEQGGACNSDRIILGRILPQRQNILIRCKRSQLENNRIGYGSRCI